VDPDPATIWISRRAPTTRARQYGAVKRSIRTSPRELGACTN
jgi:hypothetical protein